MNNYSKEFTKRLLLLFILNVYSEYRRDGDYKIFINLYLFVKSNNTKLFNLTFRTNGETTGTYNYLSIFHDNAMKIIT